VQHFIATVPPIISQRSFCSNAVRFVTYLTMVDLVCEKPDFAAALALVDLEFFASTIAEHLVVGLTIYPVRHWPAPSNPMRWITTCAAC
jgi:hypothetical protein